MHAVLPVPPPQDVGGDQDAGRGRARGEMGGVAERGHAQVRLVGAPAPEVHGLRGGRVLSWPGSHGALWTKVIGDQLDRRGCLLAPGRYRIGLASESLRNSKVKIFQVE